jgi:hypothetical protein
MQSPFQQGLDHGLPLVQLKERRRELVIAHRRRINPPAAHELMELAATQHAISACEEVIVDLDAEADAQSISSRVFLVTSR